MKFKIIVWILGFLLERASKNNPQVQQKLKGQNLTLEIGCKDGFARHFVIEDQRIKSYPGKASQPVYQSKVHEPDFAIIFENATTGFKTLTAKDKQLAMISGIHEKKIELKGNPLFLMWFQNLAKMLEK